MPKKMLINVCESGETRVAVACNGMLEDISVETKDYCQVKGNIYLASVLYVDSGLEAAFVDYGDNRHGFLPLSEIPPHYLKNKKNETGAPLAVKKGTKLLLQVSRDPEKGKKAAFTGYISLPGRFLVVMPFSSGGGISKKIEDAEERERLKKIIKELDVPKNLGVIIRTAGLAVSLEELISDYNALMEKWKTIQSTHQAARKKGLIYSDSFLVVRSVRDYFSKEIDEVIVDNKEIFKSVQTFFKENISSSLSVVKLYHGKTPLFLKYGIEKQIEALDSRTVPLSGGGSIVIDSTEALVAIDVNSGTGVRSSGQEELSFEINKTAAVEIARQLRLRDLGGLVVIDFIDMKSPRHRAQIKKIMQEEMNKGKGRVEIGNISKFGLMELSRQRIKSSYYLTNNLPCPVCMGERVVKNAEFLSNSLLKKIMKTASESRPGALIKGTGGKEVIEILNNEKRSQIQKIENDYSVSVFLYSDPSVTPGKECLVSSHEKERKQTQEKKSVSAVKRPETNSPNKTKAFSSGTRPKARRRPIRPKAPAIKRNHELKDDKETSVKTAIPLKDEHPQTRT